MLTIIIYECTISSTLEDVNMLKCKFFHSGPFKQIFQETTRQREVETGKNMLQ